MNMGADVGEPRSRPAFFDALVGSVELGDSRPVSRARGHGQSSGRVHLQLLEIQGEEVDFFQISGNPENSLCDFPRILSARREFD